MHRNLSHPDCLTIIGREGSEPWACVDADLVSHARVRAAARLRGTATWESRWQGSTNCPNCLYVPLPSCILNPQRMQSICDESPRDLRRPAQFLRTADAEQISFRGIDQSKRFSPVGNRVQLSRRRGVLGIADPPFVESVLPAPDEDHFKIASQNVQKTRSGSPFTK